MQFSPFVKAEWVWNRDARFSLGSSDGAARVKERKRRACAPNIRSVVSTKDRMRIKMAANAPTSQLELHGRTRFKSTTKPRELWRIRWEWMFSLTDIFSHLNLQRAGFFCQEIRTQPFLILNTLRVKFAVIFCPVNFWYTITRGKRDCKRDRKRRHFRFGAGGLFI